MTESSDSTLRFIQDHLLRGAELRRATAQACGDTIARAAERLIACYRSGGKVLLCGNGGSAADCQHLASELVNVLDRSRSRRALPAIALTTDTSFLTANANDFGFEHVFERQVEALGREGDVLIGITTSGRSANVRRALERARLQGLGTVLLTGSGGVEAAGLADVAVVVPSGETQLIQELHVAVGHLLCELVELAVGTDGALRT